MRKGYQLSKWRRRADTLHRKAQDLAEDIEKADGEWGGLSGCAHEVATSALQLTSVLSTDDLVEISEIEARRLSARNRRG